MNRLMKVSCLMIAGSAAAFSQTVSAQDAVHYRAALEDARKKLRASIGTFCMSEGLVDATPHCLDGKLVVCINHKFSLQDSWTNNGTGYRCKAPEPVQRERWRYAYDDDPRDQGAMEPVANSKLNTYIDGWTSAAGGGYALHS